VFLRLRTEKRRVMNLDPYKTKNKKGGLRASL
jgi:hypothetical protein